MIIKTSGTYIIKRTANLFIQIEENKNIYNTNSIYEFVKMTKFVNL